MDGKSLRRRHRILCSLHLQKKAAASFPWHAYSHSLTNQLLFPPDLHKGELLQQADFSLMYAICPPVHSITLPEAWGAELWDGEDDEGPPPLESPEYTRPEYMQPEQSDSIATGLVRGYKSRDLSKL